MLVIQALSLANGKKQFVMEVNLKLITNARLVVQHDDPKRMPKLQISRVCARIIAKHFFLRHDKN